MTMKDSAKFKLAASALEEVTAYYDIKGYKFKEAPSARLTPDSMVVTHPSLLSERVTADELMAIALSHYTEEGKRFILDGAILNFEGDIPKKYFNGSGDYNVNGKYTYLVALAEAKEYFINKGKIVEVPELWSRELNPDAANISVFELPSGESFLDADNVRLENISDEDLVHGMHADKKYEAERAGEAGVEQEFNSLAGSSAGTTTEGQSDPYFNPSAGTDGEWEVRYPNGSTGPLRHANDPLLVQLWNELQQYNLPHYGLSNEEIASQAREMVLAAKEKIATQNAAGLVPETWEEEIFHTYQNYGAEKALELDKIRDSINTPRGLTPAEAMTFIGDLAINPDEAARWVKFLTKDLSMHNPEKAEDLRKESAKLNDFVATPTETQEFGQWDDVGGGGGFVREDNSGVGYPGNSFMQQPGMIPSATAMNFFRGMEPDDKFPRPYGSSTPEEAERKRILYNEAYKDAVRASGGLDLFLALPEDSQRKAVEIAMERNQSRALLPRQLTPQSNTIDSTALLGSSANSRDPMAPRTMRTKDEEGMLKHYLSQVDEAAKRGIGIPPAVLENIKKLKSMTPYQVPQASGSGLRGIPNETNILTGTDNALNAMQNPFGLDTPMRFQGNEAMFETNLHGTNRETDSAQLPQILQRAWTRKQINKHASRPVPTKRFA